jgi:hypothetical protein
MAVGVIFGVNKLDQIIGNLSRGHHHHESINLINRARAMAVSLTAAWLGAPRIWHAKGAHVVQGCQTAPRKASMRCSCREAAEREGGEGEGDEEEGELRPAVSLLVLLLPLVLPEEEDEVSGTASGTRIKLPTERVSRTLWSSFHPGAPWMWARTNSWRLRSASDKLTFNC